tara:strand:+ start:1953 stop:2150 length:198 start_codon:yes stop_codon:yes gene_type:complete
MARKKPARTVGRSTKKNSYRVRDGKEVRPAKYYGKHVGHGSYMAGTIDGELVVDSSGKPIPYKQI